MKILQVKAKIISNKRFIGNYWHLEFEAGALAKNALPGQFVNIRVTDSCQPLLRRPVSIHGAAGLQVKLFYEVVGQGTQALSARRSGELLDIIGPLGNGFDLRLPAAAGQPILVAGGMGVAPLVFLAQRLLRPSRGVARNDTIVLIGAKTKKQILCAQEFKKLGCTVKLATDDGSSGFKGRVTDLLKVVLEQTKPLGLFSCGPRAMLKAVSVIAQANKTNAQLSLEEHMACGIGACLGCVIPTRDGYKRACKDGPVFSSQELLW